MRDILVTSSVLILALLALREVFRKAVSRRVQYALWGLVLARLLVPVSLPATEYNVLTTTEPVRTQFSQQLEGQTVYVLPTEPVPFQLEGDKAVTSQTESAIDAADGACREETTYYLDGAPVDKMWPLEDVLTYLWYAGMAVMACWLVISNLRFWRKLRKGRTPYSIEGCRLPVYLCGDLPSPCLFGLFRPAIYLTPAAVSSPESLRHVLAHETTHARHLDPLWSLLRGVCLAVYWFDPLVWIAAAASKADCELACDEGALKQLGQGERIAYGKTLLSLIPVTKRPANPLLSATTMTAGKRQLKDRITRIAENRQTAAAALLMVVAAAALLCAVTFTGAKTSPTAQGDGPLTGAEMKYFNEEFFNGGGFNIRNQFLTCLYETPEDIDLLSLFYNGTGLTESPDAAERLAVVEQGYDGYDPEIDLTKCSAADMDAVLTQYTGLTLAETHQVDLDAFTYIPAYDAYYSFHGDTNARGEITFFAGEREDGTVRLYYTDFYFGGYGTACVTLAAQPDGSYWFVSHLLSEMPAIPPVLPDWDPAMTISLEDLEPYEAPSLTVERHTGDVEQRLYGTMASEDYSIDIYRSTDGNVYAAVVPAIASEPRQLDCFLTLPDGTTFSYDMVSDFYGLLGHDGVVISYYGQTGKSSYGIIDDYYYVTDDGAPVLLARVCGEVCVSDLDGDGDFELAASAGGPAQLFFQRDGVLYCADVEALVEAAWPEAQYLSFGNWDINSRCLYLSGEVPIPDSDMSGTAFRYLYFNGSELLIYRDEGAYTDHVKDTVDAPEDVLAAAKEYVMSQYVQGVLCYDLVDGDFVQVREDYDDWRITKLSGPYYEDTGGLRVEIWKLSYECHTSAQHQVSLAGGSYITEDRWCMIGYPGCDYLYFLLAEDGARTYLYHAMENDCSPGTELFRTDMVWTLMGMELLSLSDLDGQTLLDMLWVQPSALLNNLAEYPPSEQAAAITALGAYIAAGGTGVQEIYASCEGYIDVFDSDLSDGGKALWAWLQAAVDTDPLANGSVFVNRQFGRTLVTPAAWQDIADVEAGSGQPDLVFALYETRSRDAGTGGLVWVLHAYTEAALRAEFPNASWSGVFSASSYIIGSDGRYVYVLSTPTDVQFPAGDPAGAAGQVQYLMLKQQSQVVLEDFLARNGITPNPLCSDADGCYHYTETTAPTVLTQEEALAQFTANPVAFLRSVSLLAEDSQREVCRALATYYDGGPSAQQARFRDAMRSVTQEGLGSGATAVYELLRTSCALPGPAERTARDEEEITDIVWYHLDSFRKSPGFQYLNIYEWAIDEEETARAVSRYTASLLANGNGWTDEYTSRMVAVRAAYDSYYDFSKPGPWFSQENGIGAMYFYLLPDPISGTWEIWDSTATSAPSEPSVDCLETAIHNAIMENCQNSYAASMPFQTEAHHVYAIQTLRPDRMFVYAEIVYHAYDKDKSGPTLENGCAFPVRLTFDASTENTLRLTEFWKPLDGEEYTSSIREKILETEIADELIACAYSSQLSDQCGAAARAWFESLKT